MNALERSILGSHAVDDERCRLLAELGHDPPPDDDEAFGPSHLSSIRGYGAYDNHREVRDGVD